MKTVHFELTTPIKYANGSGDEVEANFIELREPTGKVTHICCEIESLIQSGILKMAGMLDDDLISDAKEKAKEKDIDDVIDVDGILSVMTGGGVDMNKAVLHFRELFKQVAFMGGEKLITAARMDDMSHNDLRKMIGVYSANFIMRSQ